MTEQELKDQFDKVVVKHHKTEGSLYRATHAALVKGTTVYIGVSICDEEDQFNRRVGKAIALGRAFYGYGVNNYSIQPRSIRVTHTAPYLERIEAKSQEEVEKILDEKIFLKDPK